MTISGITSTSIDSDVQAMEMMDDLEKWCNEKESGFEYERRTRVALKIQRCKGSVLDLSRQYIPSLPLCIGKLHQLEELDISYNNFWTLPSEIGDLIHLRIFNISNCRLLALPQIHLSGLTELRLANNHLKNLPIELAELPAACLIDVRENPLSLRAIQTFQAAIAARSATDPHQGPRLLFSVPPVIRIPKPPKPSRTLDRIDEVDEVKNES